MPVLYFKRCSYKLHSLHHPSCGFANIRSCLFCMGVKLIEHLHCSRYGGGRLDTQLGLQSRLLCPG